VLEVKSGGFALSQESDGQNLNTIKGNSSSSLMNGQSYVNVWRLAWPNVVSNILMVSVSFAHLWIVAPFGSSMSAAVVTGGRIHFLLMAASMALSVATTAVVARAKGAVDSHGASAATTASLSLVILVSLIIGLTTYAITPQFVGIFKLDPEAHQLAIDYVRPTAILNIIFAIALTIATSFRAIGDVVRPLIYSGYATVLAISASYMLVHGTFGLPALGIKGIVFGTAFGQACVVLWFLVNWLFKQYSLVPVPKAAFERSRLSQLLTIGAPAALEQILIQVSFLAFMVLVAGYGTAAFAAYGIGITILSVCIVIGLGCGTASATLSGINLGAGDPESAIQNGWITAKLAAICMTTVSVLIFSFRGPLAATLSIDPEIQALTEYFIIILAIIQPLMAIEFAIGGALRGGGDTRYPLIVTFTGMIVGRLSIGFFVASMGAPVEVMYAVIIGDYLIKAVMLTLRFRSDKWLEAAGKHIPLAVQSEAGVGRGSVRSYAAIHADELDD
jgi:putative MATE family efflux protein